MLKNVAHCLEHILEVTLDKTVAVRPHTSHLTNHSSKTNKICGRSNDGLINDVLTGPLHMDVPVFVDQFRVDTRCSLEDLSGEMGNVSGWQERARKIRDVNMT